MVVTSSTTGKFQSGRLFLLAASYPSDQPRKTAEEVMPRGWTELILRSALSLGLNRKSQRRYPPMFCLLQRLDFNV